jgi:hypothetical protein
MTSPELENLVGIGKLKREPPSRSEFDGLVRSGQARLRDAANESLSRDIRFDLAYNAAHALALAALRRMGYRCDNRYLVFQALPHTLGLAPATWRVLAKSHEKRNQSEYGGVLEIDDRLLSDLIEAARAVLAAVNEVEPPEAGG